MKKAHKLLHLLALLIPISVFGQTYTFESGENGYYDGSAWTNLSLYNGTSTGTANLVSTTTASTVLGTTAFHPLTYSSNISSADLTAFASTKDCEVTWKEWLNTATDGTKSGMILRAQTSYGYSTSARQGYYFLANHSGVSGRVRFRLLAVGATVTTVADATKDISGYTSGPLYLKAKVVGTALTFSYSTDNVTWTVGSSGTNANFTNGTVQIAWAYGGGSFIDVYLDDITFTNLTAPKVSLVGNDKYTYTGSAQGPSTSTDENFTSTPTITYNYEGIGNTSYTKSTTAPSAVGTYMATADATYSSENAKDTLAYEILPTTVDLYYTFNDDVVGSVAANTTYLSASHLVQNNTGYMLGYKSKGKMLQNTGNSVTTLTNFGTSTNYSVIWKEYATATGQKRGVILRGDASNTIQNPGSGTTNTGYGYMFYVLNTSETNIQMDIRKLTGPTTGPATLVSNGTIPYSNINKAIWYRATVDGSTLTFAYSSNAGTTWTTACSTTDATYTSGLTQITAINGGGTSYYNDYFGFTDLTKNVTADDNKFVYTGSALTPIVSYPGFTSPSTTLTYTGTGGTSYSASSTAPSAVGTYVLNVSASEGGVTRTGTFAFEIVPSDYDNLYTFKSDVVGNTPANIVYQQGATSGAGVVSMYAGTDNGSAATAITFKPTAGGSLNGTGVADLTSITSSGNYSVTWKEYFSATGSKKGFLLQGQAGSCAYATDMKQGYLFIVYNDPTNGTMLRIYKADASGISSYVVNANNTIANPSVGSARWYRATVAYGTQKFEYSDDGTTWVTGKTWNDLTYAGLSGSTQAVYGLGAGVGNYYYDYIASSAIGTSLSGGGNWSSATWTKTPTASSDIVITDGEVAIDANTTVNSVTLNPGAKLTVNSGKSLNLRAININSDASGTATFVNNGTATITTANVQQYLPQGRNWYVGIPFTDASAVNSSTLLSGGATSVSYWDEATGAWVNTYSGAMSRGKGYIAVSASGSATNNISFSGTLNSGNVPVTVTRTVGVTKEGFNLIANPYPSYLNAMTAINASTKMEPTIWYRTKAASYSFETVNTASGEGTNNVTGYVPPMQAFWVRVKPNSVDPLQDNSETLTFTDAMRYHANPIVSEVTIATTPLKAPSATKSVTSKLRLVVSNGINSDEALIYTNANAANGYDIYDSQKMSNSNKSIPEICTIVDEEHLVINGLNSIQPNMEIPLGFTTGESNTFSIKATELSNFDPDTKVYLKDNLLNTEQKLTSDTDYSFTSDSVTASTRFSIIFKTTGVTTGINDVDTTINISKNANNQIVVNCNGDIISGASVTVYNALGQKIQTKRITETRTIIDSNFASGVYVVTVNNGGKSVTRKLILN